MGCVAGGAADEPVPAREVRVGRARGERRRPLRRRRGGAPAPGAGRVVVVSWVHGLVASPLKAGYVAAKHGVMGLVKVLALEGAEHGISASALCPAYVRTHLAERQLAERGADDLLAPQAVKRLLEPSEVAAAA